MAWYYAMGLALKEHNLVLIKLLWQAALTVTVRARLAPAVETLLRASMLESEKFKGFEKMSDNFVIFRRQDCNACQIGKGAKRSETS